MERTTKQGARPSARTIAVALLAGLVVLLLLFPGSGNDPIPPQCFSMFGYSVPCGDGLAIAAGAATAVLVGLALWLRERRR